MKILVRSGTHLDLHIHPWRLRVDLNHRTLRRVNGLAIRRIKPLCHEANSLLTFYIYYTKNLRKSQKLRFEFWSNLKTPTAMKLHCPKLDRHASAALAPGGWKPPILLLYE